MERIETFSEEETFALGEKIGREAKPGQVYTYLVTLVSVKPCLPRV